MTTSGRLRSDYFDSGLKSAKMVVLLSITFVVIMLGLAAKDALVAVTLAADEHKELATDTRAALSGVVQELDATLQRVSVTADVMAGAAQEQRKQALETTKQVTALVYDLRETAYIVNNSTIPTLNSAIADSSKNVGLVAQEAATLIYDTNVRLESLLEGTTVVVNNAAESSAKLNAAMTDVQSTLKHTDETMANVALTSKHIEKAVERSTRPAKWFVTVVKTVWDQILKIWTAFK